MSIYSVAPNNASTQQAQSVLQGHFHRGIQQGTQLFERVKRTIITDYMIQAEDMRFESGQGHNVLPGYFPKVKGDDTRCFNLHRHALSQMATQTGIPIKFVNTLTQGEQWERDQLSRLLTERFQKLDFKQMGGGKDRFLNRVVGDQVRGFMSRMYKRHLSSGPILEAFSRGCSKFQAVPVSAVTTDLSFTLRCFLPYVFEPVPGEYIGIGCSCSNSDFGAGTLRIGLAVLRVKGGHISYVKDTHTERHRGKVDNSAIESVELSQNTISKQISAKQSEIEDIVSAALHPDEVNKFLGFVAKARDKQVSWFQLEKYLQGKLLKDELQKLQELLEQTTESDELPPVDTNVDGVAIANLWWAATAIGKLADEQVSDERKLELQDAAGALLLK